MLSKGEILVAENLEGQFLSSLFLVWKKDGGNCPVIYLKELNKAVPYAQFKMEGLFLLKETLLTVGIYVHDRFERRIFCCPIVKKLPEICQVSKERPVIRTFISMIRTFFNAKSFH